MIKQVKVSDVQYDLENYPRSAVNKETVNEYKAAMADGAKFPAIIVYEDEDANLYLADGIHRLHAAQKLGSERIGATVRKGTDEDALAFAVGANYKHGLSRTSSDKRKAVELVLRSERLRNRSKNSIAKMCNVSWDTVRTVWREKKDELGLPAFNETKPEEADSESSVGSTQSSPDKPIAFEALTDALRATERASSWLTYDLQKADIKDKKKKEMLTALDNMHESIHQILGETACAVSRIESTVPLNVYEFERSGGITRNKEFEKKKLATHSVAVGLGCGNQCAYCSTSTMLRTQPAFQKIHQSSFTRGNAIVDPKSAERLKENILKEGWGNKLTADDTILFSNIDDGWSPEAQVHDLGRKVLEVLLENTQAQIRVLTKGAGVEDSFDLIEKYHERVIISLSTGIPENKAEFAEAIEPNAAPISERYRIIQAAHDRGLRTYGMLCPCLPGIADSKTALKEMFGKVIRAGAEDIWVEPVNARGRSMHNTADALAKIGKFREAKRMLEITSSDKWSEYTLNLTQNAIAVAKERKVLDKLHILMYPSDLRREDEEVLREYGDEIIWL